MHLAHTLTGFGILFFMLCKLVLHYYLDGRHLRSLGLMSLLISPGYYLRPYRLSVDPSAAKWKYLCNSCLVLTAVSLFLNILIGLAIFVG